MREFLTTAAAIGVLIACCGVACAKPRPRVAVQNQAAEGRDVGYFSNYLTGPAGMKTPVRDYPGSATVITRKMMDDFQARSVCDALRLAPGVSVGGCW
jgi:outer membrane receptor for ferric coprogen and ferric-rhodotorulic acid